MYSMTWFWGINGVVYLTAHPLLGVITYSIGLMIFKFNLTLIYLDKNYKTFGGNLFKITLCIQIFAWCTQFIGHGCYEKRAPALLTNFLFMFIAPFFAVLEVLEILLEFEKERTMEYKKIAEADIAHYRI